MCLRNEYGIFEKVSYGGCVLRNASAMIAEREAQRKGIEHLTVLFPTVVSSFDFQVENSGRTMRSLRVSSIFVNLIPPEPEIREQNMTTNGYDKMCTTTSTFSPMLSALWTTT